MRLELDFRKMMSRVDVQIQQSLSCKYVSSEVIKKPLKFVFSSKRVRCGFHLVHNQIVTTRIKILQTIIFSRSNSGKSLLLK